MRPGPALIPVALALVACGSASSSPSPSATSSSATAPLLPLSAPWPTTPPYSLADDLTLRRALAGEGVYPTVRTLLQDDVFLLTTSDGEDLAAIGGRVHAALEALLNGRFSRLPAQAVTVHLARDGEDFDALCDRRLNRSCASFLGIWIGATREILVDLELGESTLVHELTHPLLAADAEAVPGGPPAWNAPRWLREGIAALYELPVLQGKEIHGATNWRLADLRRAQASAKDRGLVHLDALFRMPDDLFDNEDEGGAAYSVARFACQYWDSAGQDRLWRFYRTWRAHAADDPTGETSFVEVFGQTAREADVAWQKWLRGLRQAG